MLSLAERSKIPLREAHYTEQVISDFHRILYNGELLTFAEFNHQHEYFLDFIKDAAAKSTAKTKIVVSHHVPSFRMQCPKFADSLANGAFTVELEDYIAESGIDFWIFGHSHYNTDAVIGKTSCICNQLGYVFNGETTPYSYDGYPLEGGMDFKEHKVG